MSARLLLVDDEPGLREAVQAYLEDSNFAVEVASNARDGWELLQQTNPDLVISDIMMPQVDVISFSSKCGKILAIRPCRWYF
jgi:DNA-binding response OmpR family regulator